MNSQNSFANAQKTVPAEYVPPIVIAPLLRDYRFIQGVSVALRETRLATYPFNRKQTTQPGGRRG